MSVHQYACCVANLRAHAGKYDKDTLPKGPRSALFRQILPGAQPLLQVMQEVAEARGKTVPQVDSVFVTLHVMVSIDTLCLSIFCWRSFQC